ncbi:SURF1 family protein [Pseudarthrobacter sp. J1763]|uniref:SURF1 family protein n=1 Tax=Pseudarthrobacter sp. J1763 TaxID=3420445 RepID=UPI003D27D5D5
MLKTALKPRWIAGLILALVLSAAFVLLSQWQFGRSSQAETPTDPAIERVKPLTQTLKPGDFFHGSVADQMVSASGDYDAAKQVLVKDRLLNGQKGYWVVTPLKVDGAPVLKGAGASTVTYIPVARGWISDPGQATAPPSGKIQLEGRLVPSEAPIVDKTPEANVVSTLSVAELINRWGVSSYPGFVGASSEISDGAQVGANDSTALKPLHLKAQPAGDSVNWLNLFYALEWIVFAGFALFIWWRLVKDDYQRELEEREDETLDSQGTAAAALTMDEKN